MDAHYEAGFVCVFAKSRTAETDGVKIVTVLKQSDEASGRDVVLVCLDGCLQPIPLFGVLVPDHFLIRPHVHARVIAPAVLIRVHNFIECVLKRDITFFG